MEAVVVIYAAKRNIPAVFQAAVHHQGKEGGRENIQVFRVFTHFIHPGLQFFLYLPEKAFVIGGIRQMLRHGVTHDIGKTQGVNIGDFHAAPRDYEFPAGSHRIIAGILSAVAQPLQPFDDNIIVGILGKAQPLLGQLGSQLIYGQGRIPADPEIDFRIDETKLQACLEAETGQEIEAVAALRCHAAQHHALAVVALLHPGIEIAVQVKGKKIFLQQFQRASSVSLPASRSACR